MLLVPVLLATLAIAIRGQPRLAVHEHGKMCSRWMTRSSAQDLRSSHGNNECAGQAAIERRGFHARVCCPASAVTRSEDDFPTECGKQQYEPHRKRIVGGSEARPNSWVRNRPCTQLLIVNRSSLSCSHGKFSLTLTEACAVDHSLTTDMY